MENTLDTTVANETDIQSVSNDTTTQVDSLETTTDAVTEEWVAPASKEELDNMLKAQSNKTYTKALKDLGVSSVKEFKALQSKLETDRAELDTLTSEKAAALKSVQDLTAKYESLKQESVLDKLNVQSEYREDLTKLALDKVTEEKPFEKVLEEMVADKYKYAVSAQKGFRMGSEKNEAPMKTKSNLSKKYPWIKD